MTRAGARLEMLVTEYLATMKKTKTAMANATAVPIHHITKATSVKA